MLYLGVVVDNEFDHDHRVQKEIRLLQQAGHIIFVLCFDFGGNYKTYDNIEVTRIKIAKPLKNLLVILSTILPFYEMFWAKRITKWINTNILEAVHAHDLYMTKAARVGINDSNHKHIKLTIDLHENYPAAINTYKWATKGIRRYIVNPKLWYKKEPKYLKLADNIITLSESFKQELLSKFPFLKDKQIAIHPNIPDLETLEGFKNSKLKVEYTSELPTLFYFGVVAQRRGIIQILPWLNELLEEGLNFNVLIIGPTDKADKEQFLNLINNDKLKDHVTYIEWSDIDYLPAYLKKIQIGLAPFEVNPQHDSGVANKLYQYMFGKIPILATACKAQKELIESSNCGLIYNDKNDFKEKLSSLLNDTDLRKEMGKNGIKALQQLLLNKVDKEFLELYY